LRGKEKKRKRARQKNIDAIQVAGTGGDLNEIYFARAGGDGEREKKKKKKKKKKKGRSKQKKAVRHQGITSPREEETS